MIDWRIAIGALWLAFLIGFVLGRCMPWGDEHDDR
jgi:hypothetical protein